MKFIDFLPYDPMEGPPIPRGFSPHWPWINNPGLRWLTPEQRAELERLAGSWAARRAEAMTAPSDGFETAKRIAESMYESYKARALAWLPPAPPKARRERKAKAAPEFEELEKALKPTILTPELETRLTDAILEVIIEDRERHKRMPRTEELINYARMVVDWAGEEGVTLTEEQGMAIVNKALARFAPART
jgi:hypothetical protein